MSKTKPNLYVYNLLYLVYLSPGTMAVIILLVVKMEHGK